MPLVESSYDGPSDTKLWLALMAHEAHFEQFTVPGSLKNAMFDHLKTIWHEREITQDLGNFALLFRSRYHRTLCHRWCQSPAADLFSSVTFRKLKSSRLEGEWDSVLTDYLDWVEDFAGDQRSRISFMDCERILSCEQPDGATLALYQKNLDSLFNRTISSGEPAFLRKVGFLSDLSDTAYGRVYSALSRLRPKQVWDIRQIMWEIHNRSNSCKIVMLHVCFWYNPNLVEPAHRADNKRPLFHHFKAILSKYNVNDPLYHADRDWEAKALALQRTVVQFTLHNWNILKSPETFLRERLTGDALVPYGARFTKDGWAQLVCELHNNFDISFGYTDLIPFNGPGMLDSYSVQRQCAPLIQYSQPAPRSCKPMRLVVTENVQQGARDDNADVMNHTRSRRPLPQRKASSNSDSEYSAIIVDTGSPEQAFEPSRKQMSYLIKQESENGSREFLDVAYSPAATYDSRPASRQTESSISSPSVPSTVVSHGHNETDQASADIERPRKRARQASYVQPSAQWNSPTVSNVSSETLPNPASFVADQPSTGKSSVDYDADNGGNSSSEPAYPAQRPYLHNLQPQPPPTALYAGSSQPQPRPTYSRSPPSTVLANPLNNHRFRILPPPPRQPSLHSLENGSPSPSPLMQSTLAPLVTPTKLEQAIELLQEEYGGKFTLEEQLRGIACLKDEVDAGIFLTLKPGCLRDRWLRGLIAGRK